MKSNYKRLGDDSLDLAVCILLIFI